MGGMQALQWAVSYPERVALAIPIAATARLSAQAIAFNEVGRQAILADPEWMGGDYYERGLPASRVGPGADDRAHHVPCPTRPCIASSGATLRDRAEYGFDFVTDFQVESYLHHQGVSFVRRFDANSYLYLTKAMDYFDLTQGNGSLRKAFAGVQSRFLVISFSSDWLFPSYQSKEIASALRQNDIEVVYSEIQSDAGHDAFLVEHEALGRLVGNFLDNGWESIREEAR